MVVVTSKKLHGADRAMLARMHDAPNAGDVVVLRPRDEHSIRYVVAVVYLEAKGERPYQLLRINDASQYGVGALWFERFGRADAAQLEVVERGAFASRVDFWRKRYPW